jgi:hypothetical protein
MVYSFILQNLDVLMKDPVVNNYLIFVLTKLTSEGKLIIFLYMNCRIKSAGVKFIDHSLNVTSSSILESPPYTLYFHFACLE